MTKKITSLESGLKTLSNNVAKRLMRGWGFDRITNAVTDEQPILFRFKNYNSKSHIEMREWLKDNVSDKFNYTTSKISFKEKDDAMKFKLMFVEHLK